MIDTPFRAGLVGAGYISEYHVAALRGLEGLVDIVGIHDLDEARAQDAAERFEIPSYGSIEALVDAGANVIHVLTPPHTHAAVALEALHRGCHVLVEKPLATDVEACREIERLAEERGLSVCVDHTLLFDPQIQRAMRAVRSGRLGRVVSVDFLRSTVFPPWESGPLPAQYREGGYPFRDQAVHALSLFEAFLGEIQEVETRWLGIGAMDPNVAYDEWAALVRCDGGLGRMGLSWNVRPLQNQLIIQGTKGVLRVDLFLMFQGWRGSTPLPKAVERLINAWTDLGTPLRDVARYVLGFLRGRVVPYQGLHNLAAEFYSSLREGRPPPVSAVDGARVVKWIEEAAGVADEALRDARGAYELSEKVDVLVTGGLGNLGHHVVERLRADGHSVRVLTRRIPGETPHGVEVALGDLGDAEAVDRAVRGARAVVHAGAAMTGGPEEHHRATVVGTENVIDSCLRHGVEKFVHISSLSVVDWSVEPVISETTPYEPRPDERGAYTKSKLAAERLVLEAVSERGLPAVVLRPGQIFGGRTPLLSGATARRLGDRFVVLGNGDVPLPLVHVEDVAEAVVRSFDRDLAAGEVLQIVGEPLTQNEVLEMTVAPKTSVIRLPRPFVFLLAMIAQLVFRVLGRRSPLSVRQVETVTAARGFDGTKARHVLEWEPRHGAREPGRETKHRAPAA